MWVNLDVRFPLHMANLRIAHHIFISMFQGMPSSQVLQSPVLIHEVCKIFLEHINNGQYRDATLVRFGQGDPAHAPCWILTLMHPTLPKVEEGMMLEEIPITITHAELERLIEQIRCILF